MAEKSMTAFEKAFDAARKRGDSRFDFNGKVYKTNRADKAPIKQTDFTRDYANETSRMAAAAKSAPRGPSFDPSEDQSITSLSGMPDDLGSEMLEGAKAYLPAGLATAAGVGATALGLRKLAAKKAADIASSLARTKQSPDMKRAIGRASDKNYDTEMLTDGLKKKADAAKTDQRKRSYGNPESIPRANRKPGIPEFLRNKNGPRDKQQMREDADMYDAPSRMADEGGRHKRGGAVAAYAKGGSVSSRGDGIAQRGKTNCKYR